MKREPTDRELRLYYILVAVLMFAWVWFGAPGVFIPLLPGVVRGTWLWLRSAGNEEITWSWWASAR